MLVHKSHIQIPWTFFSSKRNTKKVVSVCYKTTLFSEAIQPDDTHSGPISILRPESIPALNLQKHDWTEEPTLPMNSRWHPIHQIIKPKKITAYTRELRSCAGPWLFIFLVREKRLRNSRVQRIPNESLLGES